MKPDCVVEHIQNLGDGLCDRHDSYNSAECGWDGGDCCGVTCVDGTFECGARGFDCKDPAVRSRGEPE